MRSEDGFIGTSVRFEGCIQVAENDNNVMSRKGGNEVCEDVVKLVFVGVYVAVRRGVAGNHLQTAMVVLEGVSEQALGDGAPRDQGAGGRWVKCKFVC